MVTVLARKDLPNRHKHYLRYSKWDLQKKGVEKVKPEAHNNQVSKLDSPVSLLR